MVRRKKKKKIFGRYVGETYFIFCIFSPRKKGSGLKLYENTGFWLRVDALQFYFAFLLIKNSRVGYLKKGRSG